MTFASPQEGQQMAILTQDTTAGGAGTGGIGASCNGVNTCAASYQTAINSLVAYDLNGAIKWISGTLFGTTAKYSAPLVDATGKVVFADSYNIGFFNADGSVFSYSATPGGRPFSPVFTNNRVVILATMGGPISAYSLDSGALLGSYYPQDPGNPNYYDTKNTPSVVGNRVYISMALQNDPADTGRLYAFDISNSTVNPIVPVSYFTFGGPSGASPTCVPNLRVGGVTYSAVVYFDGWHQAPGNVGPPTIFAVGDTGSSLTPLWSSTVTGGYIKSNMPVDMSGKPGLWYFPNGTPKLIKLSLDTGKQIESISTAHLLGPNVKLVPTSTMQMASDQNGDPEMFVGLEALPDTSGGSYVVGLNTLTGQMNWSLQVATSAVLNKLECQFPLIVDGQGTVRLTFVLTNLGMTTAAVEPQVQ